MANSHLANNRHWSEITERGSLLGIKLLMFLYRFGGRYLVTVALFPVILYFYLTGHVARKASKQYLNRLYQQGYLLAPPNWLLSFKHFLSMGASALDKVDVWLGKITFESIEHENLEYFSPLLEQKKGALIIGSHLGNLEVCRALSSDNSTACFNVLVFTKNAIKFNDFLNTINENVRLNLIEVENIGPDLAITLQEKIAQGEYVVIAGDRTSTSVEERVIYSPFLGHEAPFAQGPFILAGILQCPVLMMFCLKNKTNKKYHLIFEKLSNGIHWTRKTRQQELTLLVNNYACALEKYCALYPLQWFNFFDFWQRDNVKRLNNSETDKC